MTVTQFFFFITNSAEQMQNYAATGAGVLIQVKIMHPGFLPGLSLSSHLPLHHQGHRGTTDDFTTSFLHFFSCSSLPSGTWRTPGLSIPYCCHPTSSSVCLAFFPLSLRLARRFWPDLTNGRHDHAIAVSVSLRWSGGLHVVQVPAGSWHGLPGQ